MRNYPTESTRQKTSSWHNWSYNPPVVKEAKKSKEPDFFDIFEDYIAKKNISEWRIKHLRVLKRALMRYELYVRANGNKRYKIKLNDFTVEDINKFEKFLRSEHLIYI